ncbi:MAG: hypothetical protein Kow0013_25160 [Pararhodobacter sp.]
MQPDTTACSDPRLPPKSLQTMKEMAGNGNRRILLYRPAPRVILCWDEPGPHPSGGKTFAATGGGARLEAQGNLL